MLFELIVINTEFQFLGGCYGAGLMICREAQHARMGEEFTAYAPSSTNRIRAAAPSACSTTAFGRVSWFLMVRLATTITASRGGASGKEFLL